MTDDEKLERKRASNRAWYERNRAKVLEERRVKYKADPEKIRRRNAIWRNENRDRMNELRSRWNEVNKERNKAYFKNRFQQKKGDLDFMARIVTAKTKWQFQIEIPKPLAEVMALNILIKRKK